MAKFNDIRNIRVLAFLDAYQRQECLWNPNLGSYKNKADRDEAYMEIIKELNIPSLTVHDVKQKVKGIRTTYTKELRLLDKHKEQGKPYKPKLFWFHRADTFLRHVSSSRHRKSMFQNIDDTPQRPEFKDCTIEYISNVGSEIGSDEMVDGDTTEENPHGKDSRPSTPVEYKTIVHVHVNEPETPEKNERVAHKREAEPEPESQPEPESEPEPMVTDEQVYTESAATSIPPTPRKNEATQVTESTIVATTALKDDEFDLFCRSVAAQLRSIPDSYSRSVAKLKIQQILFEAETGHYKHSPCITIPIVQQMNNI